MVLTASPKSRSLKPLRGPAPRGRRSRLRVNAQVTIALLIIAGFVLVSLLAPVLAPYDPDLADGGVKYLGVGAPGHLLGTDELGRDILSRLIWGGRTSLVVALAASLSSTVV